MAAARLMHRSKVPALDNLVKALTIGAHEPVACRFAGIDLADVDDLRARVREGTATEAMVRLHQRLEHAVALSEIRALQVIDLAAQDGDAKAAIWLLQHRHLERWSTKAPVAAPAAPVAGDDSAGGGDVLDELSAIRTRKSAAVAG